MNETNDLTSNMLPNLISLLRMQSCPYPEQTNKVVKFLTENIQSQVSRNDTNLIVHFCSEFTPYNMVSKDRVIKSIIAKNSSFYVEEAFDRISSYLCTKSGIVLEQMYRKNLESYQELSLNCILDGISRYCWPLELHHLESSENYIGVCSSNTETNQTLFDHIYHFVNSLYSKISNQLMSFADYDDILNSNFTTLYDLSFSHLEAIPIKYSNSLDFPSICGDLYAKWPFLNETEIFLYTNNYAKSVHKIITKDFANTDLDNIDIANMDIANIDLANMDLATIDLANIDQDEKLTKLVFKIFIDNCFLNENGKINPFFNMPASCKGHTNHKLSKMIISSKAVYQEFQKLFNDTISSDSLKEASKTLSYYDTTAFNNLSDRVYELTSEKISNYCIRNSLYNNFVRHDCTVLKDLKNLSIPPP